MVILGQRWVGGKDNKVAWGGASRWWKSKTWISPSSPQIHQKSIYMWNNSYRTPTVRWQKTSDLPKVNHFDIQFCIVILGKKYEINNYNKVKKVNQRIIFKV